MANKSQGDKIAECRKETRKHIERVRHYIYILINALDTRGCEHDRSKLDSPEIELFAEHTPKLAKLKYGSKEYKESLEALKPALDHHYAKNRHHANHFPNKMMDMNLVDLLEMFCDWKAASERQHDGNLLKSIEINAEQLKIPKMLISIMKNTVDLFENTKK